MKAVVSFVGVLLLSGCHHASSVGAAQKSANDPQVLRAHRIELTDDAGKVRAIVGFRGSSQVPEVSLLDERSVPALTLILDKRGQGTIFFRDPGSPKGAAIDGRVEVGYLWGSDCCYKPGDYDPLGSWGMRVMTKDQKGFLTAHDLVLADPNEKDLSHYVEPVEVPHKK